VSKGNIISLIILGSLIIFFIAKKIILINNASFTKGIIEKYSWSGKGNHYINYIFYVNSIEYHGSMPIDFCLNQNTNCAIGDTVIVRYKKNHPEQNDLVHKLPRGEVFTVDK
jgi:hypothetical protein